LARFPGNSAAARGGSFCPAIARTILFARETLPIQMAFQNEDDFIRNLCLRGELRSGLAVLVPAGMLKGTLPAGSLAHAAPGNSGKK
jgi:hypothetical protein